MTNVPAKHISKVPDELTIPASDALATRVQGKPHSNVTLNLHSEPVQKVLIQISVFHQ